MWCEISPHFEWHGTPCCHMWRFQWGCCIKDHISWLMLYVEPGEFNVTMQTTHVNSKTTRLMKATVTPETTAWPPNSKVDKRCRHHSFARYREVVGYGQVLCWLQQRREYSRAVTNGERKSNLWCFRFQCQFRCDLWRNLNKVSTRIPDFYTVQKLYDDNRFHMYHCFELNGIER